jgi:hypothetical protein
MDAETSDPQTDRTYRRGNKKESPCKKRTVANSRKERMSIVKDTPQEPQLSPAQHVRNDWKAFVDKVSFNGIVSNIPFIAFLALLCMVYIGNNHSAVQMQRDLNTQNKILKELRWKYMDVKTQLMNKKMESQVMRDAAVIGLKPLALPAYKIEIDSTFK